MIVYFRPKSNVFVVVLFYVEVMCRLVIGSVTELTAVTQSPSESRPRQLEENAACYLIFSHIVIDMTFQLKTTTKKSVFLLTLPRSMLYQKQKKENKKSGN